MERDRTGGPEGMRQCFIDNAVVLRPLAPALIDHAQRLQGSIDPACIAVVEAMSTVWGVSFAVAEPAREEDGPVDPLTPVEIRVLTFAASGLKNADIAAQMLIAVPTIKWHLHNIFNKWEVKTRTAAIAKARANGMLA
ncbi:LuxR family transcriptional regulator [Oleomonas cavernae]|uniref:LuxR family transcriptional regulator n=1 Tax=Oleomonas cavernae TaxID=2320859 RepID=A0A418W911_9PROT|nr:helix-turn-helix transcriptional regulator [Oleomonas cavernae]RJF86492.1 LuxR family transcriptional regulator [Oleomonas cavernae]